MLCFLKPKMKRIEKRLMTKKKIMRKFSLNLVKEKLQLNKLSKIKGYLLKKSIKRNFLKKTKNFYSKNSHCSSVKKTKPLRNLPPLKNKKPSYKVKFLMMNSQKLKTGMMVNKLFRNTTKNKVLHYSLNIYNN